MKVFLGSLLMLSLAVAPSYVRRPRCHTETAPSAESAADLSPSAPSASTSARTGTAPTEARLGRVSAALDQTTSDAKKVLARLLELKPEMSDGLSFDIAHETARWCRVYGIRWQIAVALMWHESRFDPWASSRTNDHGLGQLHGKRYFKDDGHPDVPSQIRYCLLHLKGCLDKAGGDERHALGHYNGGGYCNTRYAEEVLKWAK